jgi:hypothetical protein
VSKSCQKLSKSCQKIVKKLSKNCQNVVKNCYKVGKSCQRESKNSEISRRRRRRRSRRRRRRRFVAPRPGTILLHLVKKFLAYYISLSLTCLSLFPSLSHTHPHTYLCLSKSLLQVQGTRSIRNCFLSQLLKLLWLQLRKWKILLFVVVTLAFGKGKG